MSDIEARHRESARPVGLQYPARGDIVETDVVVVAGAGVDVADAVLFPAGDEARSITGVALPVDLGMSQKYSGA